MISLLRSIRQHPLHPYASPFGLRMVFGVLLVALLAALLAQVNGLPQASAQSAVAATGDPAILAAGDIACDPSDKSYNGGNGTATRCQERWTAAELTEYGATAVLPLGDLQYQCGTLAAFDKVYAATWGKVKSISHPVVGNEEYNQSCAGSKAGAAGYFTYFGSAATPLQSTCTAKCLGYYSYTIGTWHIIALNSECPQIGGCAVGSAEETWLRKDLAAHPNKCVLAYWHRPLYSSNTNGIDPAMRAIFQDLYNAHTDVVLNGHVHGYERFAVQNAHGTFVSTGVREFVVGTGGDSHASFSGTAANSVVKNDTTYGVLKLTLHAGSYSWQFIPDGHSGSFTDSGSAWCV